MCSLVVVNSPGRGSVGRVSSMGEMLWNNMLGHMTSCILWVVAHKFARAHSRREGREGP